MKSLLLAALTIPAIAHAQQPEPLRKGAFTTFLTLPRRAYLYQQLRDTATPVAARRVPRRFTVQLVQPVHARWLLVTQPNHRRCKVGVDYGPDPTYYIAAATAAKAKRVVLSSL
jgi:hypothetical protein